MALASERCIVPGARVVAGGPVGFALEWIGRQRELAARIATVEAGPVDLRAANVERAETV